MSNEKLLIPLLPGERWWGGKVADGLHMPYGLASYHADLSTGLGGNQGCPLLLSNKGRFVWSEEPFAFTVNDGEIIVESRGGSIETGDGFKNLREVYRHISQKYFSPTGTYPDDLLFTSPQYNLWIELLYEPTQEKVMAYAQSVLDHGMAPGVIMIDDNWHEPYGTWEFHPGRFPNPKAMVDELHGMGFKVMLWVCPFISPDSLTFRQVEKKGYLLKDQSGQTAVRRWWNGYSAVLDCTSPDAVAWFHERLQSLQDRYGIDGFKLDAGDPIYYHPDDISAYPASPNDHCEAWARIGLAYRLNEYRACWKLGGQPLAQRLMDKNHAWGDNGLATLIPHALAQGLMGYAYTCPDMIGGGEYQNFLANSNSLDPELIVRYAQCSALFPMMQFSAAPWRILSPEHLQYCVEAARLHTDLGPEILQLARHAATTGEPILRHMAYEFPDEGLEEVNNQFMLGGQILAAPVLEKGAVKRTVVFPTGTWCGDDGSVIEGPCRVEIDAPLHRLPWYRKR